MSQRPTVASKNSGGYINSAGVDETAQLTAAPAAASSIGEKIYFLIRLAIVIAVFIYTISHLSDSVIFDFFSGRKKLWKISEISPLSLVE